MKNMSVIFLSLFALTFGLCGNAVANPVVTQKSVDMYDAASTMEDVGEVFITCMNESTDECVDKTGSTAFKIAVAETVAVPVAVTVASAAGVTASTGTAIATLSGAAAVSATKAALGSALISASGGLLAGIAAPAVIGGAVIAGAGAAVGGLIWWCISD